MMVLICLYALETALAPIPERKIRTPIIPSAHETVMQEQTVIDEPPEVEQKTEMIEPEVFIHDVSGEDQEVVSLVEVEEIPTHPPFSTTPSLTWRTKSPSKLDPCRTPMDRADRSAHGPSQPKRGDGRRAHRLRRRPDALIRGIVLFGTLACATPPAAPESPSPDALRPSPPPAATEPAATETPCMTACMRRNMARAVAREIIAADCKQSCADATERTRETPSL